MRKQLNDLLQRHLEKGDYVGANAAVYQNGVCLYSGSVGYADKAAGRKMKEDTIFRIYSMTKPVTAVAIMQLVERGLVFPNAPLSQYIPEFEKMRVYKEDGTTRSAKRPILIQDLLNMRSGLTYPGEESQTQRDVAAVFHELYRYMHGRRAFSTMEIIKKLAAVPLEFDPGEHWCYGTSADVLGGVIEAVSGKDLRTYFIENIFRPLGMIDTDFYVHEKKQDRFAAAYYRSGDELKVDKGCYLGMNNYLTKPKFLSGGAGLTSTVPDYARFAQMLACGGTTPDGVRILGKHSVDYICTPQVSGDGFQADQQWDSLQGYAYGSLVRVLTDKYAAGTLANPGEFGWDGWTGTYFCTDPAEKLSILFWIQVANAGTCTAAKLMRNIVYGAL